MHRAPNEPTSQQRSSVVLVRHGQSEWNALRRWQGTADPPLTHHGRLQAREQAAMLAGRAWVGPWTSPLQRATETASILAAALGIGPLRIDERLREAHAGEWEGLTPTQIEARWPGHLSANRRPPSFEPDHEVRRRAWDAIVEIATEVAAAGPDRTALVVAHSGLMRRVAELHGHGDVGVPNLGGYRLDLVRSARNRRLGWCVEVLERFDPSDGSWRSVDIRID